MPQIDQPNPFEARAVLGDEEFAAREADLLNRLPSFGFANFGEAVREAVLLAMDTCEQTIIDSNETKERRDKASNLHDALYQINAATTHMPADKAYPSPSTLRELALEARPPVEPVPATADQASDEIVVYALAYTARQLLDEMDQADSHEIMVELDDKRKEIFLKLKELDADFDDLGLMEIPPIDLPSPH